MRLSRLAEGYDIEPGHPDADITAITEDSRRVEPGALFVAIPGTALDGHAFVDEAVARGAAAIAVERPVGSGLVPRVRVDSARAALADLAARFYNFPARELQLVGFTGTFGKTSTSEILRTLLEAGGLRTAVLGSLGARYGDLQFDTGPLTTPAPVEMQGALRRLAHAGAAAVIIEVTSHALVLQRVRGLRFDGGLLAAIMPGEHTDFHRSYDDYVTAKAGFLEHLAGGAILAHDADNRASRRIASRARVERLAGFSLDGRPAELHLRHAVLDDRGAGFVIDGPLAGRHAGRTLRSALLGRGHLRNAGLALAYALAHGIDVDTCRTVLETLRPLRRRMERYEVDGRTVLDDTAAHPDSFRATFDVVELLPRRRTIVLLALRGRRGAEINRGNAGTLTELAAIHGVDAVVLTAAMDAALEKDRVQPEEIEAACAEIIRRGGRFIWHDSLAAAAADAMARTKSGDLIVLLGAQGMDKGRDKLK